MKSIEAKVDVEVTSEGGPAELTLTEKLKKIEWLSVLVEKGKLSLGRVSFWITFIMINYMWVAEKQVQESMLMVLMVLMSYNLGKKFTSIAEVYFSKPKGSAPEE